MEDKQKILDLLLPTLQATRENADLKELTYKAQNNNEIVVCKFKSGLELFVNVTIDSGMAMIRDVLRGLG